MPADTNPYGGVFGGWLMAQMALIMTIMLAGAMLMMELIMARMMLTMLPWLMWMRMMLMR